MKAYEREALLAVTLPRAVPKVVTKPRRAWMKREGEPPINHGIRRGASSPPPNLCARVRYRYAPRPLEEGDNCPACDDVSVIGTEGGGLRCPRCQWECQSS